MLTMQHVGENPKESEPWCVGGWAGRGGKKGKKALGLYSRFISSPFISNGLLPFSYSEKDKCSNNPHFGHFAVRSHVHFYKGQRNKLRNINLRCLFFHASIRIDLYFILYSMNIKVYGPGKIIELVAY